MQRIHRVTQKTEGYYCPLANELWFPSKKSAVGVIRCASTFALIPSRLSHGIGGVLFWGNRMKDIAM